MASIDDRIVGMKFDNANFEQKLGDTLKSLNKLQQSLDFSNSKRGMDELSKASSSFNLGNMGSAVEGVSNKFLALATIGITAIANITNRAVDSGIRIAKAFSIAPIKEGFQEYETQLNSVQTILANTAAAGVTMDQVNSALQRLNEYSDKTIYNFGQMAKNIGTFTAAGVDLDTSVNAIKGIANLSALSGSSSEQASGAMYQLSQAIATGTLRLIDWNSVNAAGIGGEVFKNALFETGKAMKTLEGVPMGQTFEQWEKANGSFRASLEKDWITADVLTTTLSTFTGDLSQAELAAKGFSQAQIDAIEKVAKTAVGAATEVKTFTQLMGTVKEAVGTGWADSFKIVIGNFTEAKALWTEVNNGIGKFVGQAADARNSMLQGWKDLGGRDQLIQGFRNAIQALGSVIAPVKEAFREIFPPMTAQRLFELTQSFVRFTEGLKLSASSMETIKRIFAGLFAAVEIGWTIVKGVAGLIGDVISNLTGAAGGGLKFAANLGDTLVALNKALVEGGGIKRFFETLSEAIRNPAEFLRNLRDNILQLLQTFPGFTAVSSVVSAILARLGDRFESLNQLTKNAVDRWQGLTERLQSFGDAVRNVFSKLGEWFSGLGKALSEAIKPGDFDTAVDAVNIGLLGGILLMIRKFMNKVTDMDFTGGILSKVTEALDGVTGSLRAMQADLKAGALMKIATALGILTISIVALSLINSEALAKALTAIAVGFAQLVIVLGIMEKMSIGAAGVKLGVMASSMILLATAMAILSVAVKNLSSLGWEELAKGLIGVTLMLLALTKATQLITADTAGLIRAGIAMIPMAVALNLLALAVKSFADLSWTEMAKGLIGVSVGLGAIVLAMNLMPIGPTLAAGAALIPLATGLGLLAGAVKLFSLMKPGELAKGLISIAAGLVIIGVAMHLMPITLPITAAGLVLVGGALNLIAGAMILFGNIPFGEIAKGLATLAATMIILSVAMNAMTGTVTGAAALLIVSGALMVLATVLKILGGMSLIAIAKGIGAVAAVLLVLGVAAKLLTPVIPALYALGVALSLVGAAFALFGIGAMLVAKAFELLAEAGLVGVNVLIEVLKRLIQALPELIGAFVKALGELVSEFGMVAALIARMLGVLLSELLTVVINNAPKIAQALGAILTEGLKLLREKIPDIIETGVTIILALLRGIRDNIGKFVTLAIDIITTFAITLANNAQKLVDSALILVFAFIGAIANRAGDIVAAGVSLLVSFISGISNNVQKIVDAVGTLITKFIGAVKDNLNRIVTAGADMIISIIKGIGDNADKIVKAGVDTIIKFIDGVGKNAVRLANAAAEAMLDFINGLTAAIDRYAPRLQAAGRKLAGAIADGATMGLASKAAGVASKAAGMFGGAIRAAKGVIDSKSPSKVFMKIGEDMAEGAVIALDRDTTLSNSAAGLATRTVIAFQESMARISTSLGNMDEFQPVITPVLDLTKVQAASRGLNALISSSTISPAVSFDQARLISTTNELESKVDDAEVKAGPTEIKFEQNNYSPTALTVNDIYRNTKSQIALAKEELHI